MATAYAYNLKIYPEVFAEDNAFEMLRCLDMLKDLPENYSEIVTKQIMETDAANNR